MDLSPAVRLMIFGSARELARAIWTTAVCCCGWQTSLAFVGRPDGTGLHHRREPQLNSAEPWQGTDIASPRAIRHTHARFILGPALGRRSESVARQVRVLTDWKVLPLADRGCRGSWAGQPASTWSGFHAFTMLHRVRRLAPYGHFPRKRPEASLERESQRLGAPHVSRSAHARRERGASPLVGASRMRPGGRLYAQVGSALTTWPQTQVFQ